MKLSNLLTQPMQHCEDAAAHLLHKLNIKFTKSYLQNALTEHPNYPTLAAIADVIGMWYDVSCAPVKQTIQDYKNSPDFRLPFLAPITPKGFGHDVFAVVTQLSNNSIELYNPATQKQETYSHDFFNEIYKGVILIVEAGSKKKEDDYEAHLKKEKQHNFFNRIALLALPVLTIIIGGLHLFNDSSVQNITTVIYTLQLLAGCMVTMLLLWHEIDKYNPVVKQICRATAQVNCSAVLHSKASGIFGLSWSSIGFIYFTATLLVLLATGFSAHSLAAAGWLNALALPYTCFSLYYQWKVVKQWCTLCLIVQGLLVLLFITALSGDFYNPALIETVSFQWWFGIAAVFAFVFAAVIVVVPALKKAKNSKQKTIELQRLKHNPQIFEGLLAKQKPIAKPADGLGITIGKPDSVLKLIKVCNPYCGPCAKAHPIIEELVLNNEEVSVQIIFTATENEQDKKRAPVMHLMAIAAQSNEALTRQALDDWYNAPVKDYPAFAEKYAHIPPQGLEENVKAMRKWCDAVEINATPTFFVCMNTHDKENASPAFYQLPDIYTVADLKYFFTI